MNHLQTSDERLAMSRRAAPPAGRRPRVSRRRQFNFFALALQQIIFRVGWIFKTESVIMPAVLDLLGGSGFVRGWLPVLNRFGQSIAPLAVAGHLKSAPRKKPMLAASCLAMGLSLVVVAGIWSAALRWPGPWALVAFLVVYAVFFCAIGINHFAYGLLIGKLVPTRRRGRLMTVSNFTGVVFSAGLAAWLLPLWLGGQQGNFAAIFLMAGACFLICGAWSLVLAERSDRWSPVRASIGGWARISWKTLVEDANFRRLATAGALFGASIALFPHYQAVAREQLHVSLAYLAIFVITQNIGIAVFSLPTGWMADRHGNRLVLSCLMISLCGAPALCLLLAASGQFGADWFWMVFALVGLTPITIRTFNNYTLEIAARSDHPRYLAALNLCMAVPTMVLSPIIGALIDLIGFAPVFSLIIGGLIWGWILVLKLREPRKPTSFRRRGNNG